MVGFAYLLFLKMSNEVIVILSKFKLTVEFFIRMALTYNVL